MPINFSVPRHPIRLVAFGAGPIALLLAAIAGCQQGSTQPGKEAAGASPEVVEANAEAVEQPAAETQLPRLLDLGADKCIPCKMMAPILEQMRGQYAGKLKVEFIDVWKNPDAAKQYGIEQIPTQIFFDASGKELFRHTGFFSKEDILKTWERFGVHLSQHGDEP